MTATEHDDEPHEIRCCSDTYIGSGWKKHANCVAAGFNVWGESEINGVCQHAANFEQAKSMCDGMGCECQKVINQCFILLDTKLVNGYSHSLLEHH